MKRAVQILSSSISTAFAGFKRPVVYPLFVKFKTDSAMSGIKNPPHQSTNHFL